MRYDKIDIENMNNGPGIRVAIWVCGCEFACPGCFNEKLWDFNYGLPYTNDTEDYIIKSLNKDHIDGITLIGGEPLHTNNIVELTRLVKRIRKELPEKTIWSYTGNIYEKVKDLEIIKLLDVLIDGRFIITQFDPNKKYAGSKNQRVIDIKKTMKENKVTLYKEVFV